MLIIYAEFGILRKVAAEDPGYISTALILGNQRAFGEAYFCLKNIGGDNSHDYVSVP